MASTLNQTKSSIILIPPTIVGAGQFVRSAQGVEVKLGGSVSGRIQNGSTGPTVAGLINIYAAFPTDTAVSPAVPTSGSMGPNWFLIGYLFGASTVANEIKDLVAMAIRSEYAFIAAEATANTGQSVTASAYFARTDNVIST